MIERIIFSKNNLFFYFLLFGYIFGVILYDFIDFKYTDELMAFFLVLFTGATIWERKNVSELRPLLIIGGIFLFYTIYSVIIHSNTPQAIIMDMLIQIKPFLGFYCVYLLSPQLSIKQKKIIAIISLIIGGVIIIVGITNQTHVVFGHPSRLATAATATALLFFYCSSWEWSDIFTFLFLLTIGIFSTRAKFYGFWGVCMFLIIYYKMGGRIRLNLNGSIVISFVFLIAIGLSWKKIAIYYIDGMMNTEQMWSRPVMFLTAGKIISDYIPFGSGFASFGTYMSGVFYSHTYEEYHINNVWGLSRDMPNFICDAYYPSLAQFGIVGIILYILFWRDALLKVKKISIKNSLVIILIFVFFLIEGTSDMTFTHNRGLFMLIIMGLFITNTKNHEIAK